MHGAWIRTRCQVLSLQGMSGHADREGLLAWVGAAPSPPKVIYLVHGEPSAAAALRGHLRRRFGCHVHIAQMDQRVDLRAALASH